VIGSCVVSKNVVLLGIGHTNAHVVSHWASEPMKDGQLICISRYPTTTYSGMFPGTLGGQFSDDEMRIDLQKLSERSKASLIIADTKELDLRSHEILFHDHEPIRFDALSIGVGSMPAGWQQVGKSASLIPIKPMQTFLERLDSRLRSVEQCMKDSGSFGIRIAVVGGGVASIEIALCLQQLRARHSPKIETKISIFTSDTHVAKGMTKQSIRRIERILTERGIDVHSGQRVTQVNEDALVTEDSVKHSAECVIWATGAAPPNVLNRLDIEKDSQGFIATHDTLQSLSDPRIFAVGDCGTVVRSPSPKAGVYAVRQCPILWHNLQALFTGKKMQRFKPQADFLKLLNTGDGKALLEYGRLSIHAQWCWSLKTWIDKRFIREYQVN
jgi:pyridine nucleotide-disulfide oxidoreductase family protein